MELVRGETLEEELRRRGSFSADDLLKVAADLCGAVEAVHAAGLLHRDIKAQNVIRAEDGRLVLMDFGTGSDEGGSVPALAGTPAYLAPETLAGAAPTVESDVYALGVLLFHLATGAFPIGGLGHHRAWPRASGGSREVSRRCARRLSAPRWLPPWTVRSIAIHRRGLAVVAQFRRSLLPEPPRRWLGCAPHRVWRGGSQHRGAPRRRADERGRRQASPVTQSVSLSQVPLSIQRRFNIRAPSWDGCPSDVHALWTRCRVALQSRGRDDSCRPDAGLKPGALADVRAVARWTSHRLPVARRTEVESLRIIDADGANDRELVPASEPILSVWGWNRASTALVIVTGADDSVCVELLELETTARQKLRCDTSTESLGFASLSPDDRYPGLHQAPSRGPTRGGCLDPRPRQQDRPRRDERCLDR